MRKNAIFFIVLIITLDMLTVAQGLPYPNFSESEEAEKHVDALGLPITKGGNEFEAFKNLKMPYSPGGNRIYTSQAYGDSDEVSEDGLKMNSVLAKKLDMLGLPKNIKTGSVWNDFKADVKDVPGLPNDFTRGGNGFKAVNDGKDGHILTRTTVAKNKGFISPDAIQLAAL
ncbi:uncharacterized protein LOC126843090 isoform X1 [Adelges cooleyi]|uniref:uncharacterized protein LOC126843090 isoform X1 n=1 Tax=Adelges cooleyi TaxID=133065 RepID=UPI0021803E33|nr:uncharacterized protein LOC126843090 isoform X1 [Adelges cooleyi]